MPRSDSSADFFIFNYSSLHGVDFLSSLKEENHEKHFDFVPDYLDEFCVGLL